MGAQDDTWEYPFRGSAVGVLLKFGFQNYSKIYALYEVLAGNSVINGSLVLFKVAGVLSFLVYEFISILTGNTFYNINFRSGNRIFIIRIFLRRLHKFLSSVMNILHGE